MEIDHRIVAPSICTLHQDAESLHGGAREHKQFGCDPVDWAQLRSALERAARRLLRSESDVEDVVQAALLRALEQRASMPDEVNWKAWLTTVMRRLIVDSARKRKLSLHPGMELEKFAADPVESQPLWLSLSDSQVDDALARCQPALREVYELCCFERLSHAEVSARLSISLNTVATRLHRARLALRALLEPMLSERNSTC